MTSSDERSDRNVAHAMTRAKQPKLLVPGASIGGNSAVTLSPSKIYLVFDQPMGTVADQISDSRFRYMGTSPTMSPYERMCGRRTLTDCYSEGENY